MRRLIYLAPVLLLLLCSCSGSNSSKFKGKLTNKFLEGTWVVADADFSNNSKDRRERDSMTSYMLMMLLRFDAKGKVFSDNADSFPENGSYAASEKTLKLTLERSKTFYSLKNATDSSMILVIEKSDAPMFDNGELLFKRMDTRTYKIGNPEWKKKPAAPLSDEAISKKLYDMLMYYRHFLLATDSRNTSMFSGNKIMIPFSYYSTGVGLKPFEKRKGWDVFFGDSTHARRAYDMLGKSFYNTNKLTYNDNFFIMYADIFRILATNILPEGK